jgi:hypothetical protein
VDRVEAEVVTRLLNLFDRRYYTAAELATTGFTAQGTFVAHSLSAYTNRDFPIRSATTGFAAQATFIARPFPPNANGDFPLQCATAGFTSHGTLIARRFPANTNGDFPLRSATFFSPGVPRRPRIGLRLKL